jgi:hypothetical protein
MTIYSITQYSIDCDNCSYGDTNNQGDDISGMQIFTLKDALKYWRNLGWSIGKRILCKNCSQKRSSGK